MKKNSPRPRNSAHSPTAPNTITLAPRGLSALLRAISIDGPATTAAKDAEAVYPHARRVLDVLESNTDGLAMQGELDRAACALYGSGAEDPHLEPRLAAATGFQVGVAVCWLLMQALNGSGDVRTAGGAR
jgi:hypothetical protein